MRLYEQIVAAGCQIDHHESDLYVRVSPASHKIVEDWYRMAGGIRPYRTFTSEVDGALWYDIPFAYEPFWEGKSRTFRTMTEDGGFVG